MDSGCAHACLHACLTSCRVCRPAACLQVLNTLDLGQGGCLAGLTSLTLLNTSRKDYRARLMRAFDSLPSLACLECQFEAHAYWMHCPEDSMDAAGRKVALTMLDRRGWLLQRSLPAAEE